MNTVLHYEAADLALYSMQLLGGDERSAVEDHLSHCAICHQELSRIQGDLANYASALETHAPAPCVRERVLRRAAKEKKFPAPPRIKSEAEEDLLKPSSLSAEPDLTFTTRRTQILASSTPRTASKDTDRPETGSGSHALRAVSLGLGWITAVCLALAGSRLDRVHHADQQRIVALARENSEINRDSSDAKRLLETLKDPATQQVLLSSTSAEASGPAPQGRVIYSSSRGVLLFFASHLQPAEAGKVYELWLVPSDGGTPISAGVFSPDAEGNAHIVLLRLPEAKAAKAFGVTLEDGESQTPTMPILLVGT
jgi:anti-sigma-K factor RskA